MSEPIQVGSEVWEVGISTTGRAYATRYTVTALWYYASEETGELLPGYTLRKDSDPDGRFPVVRHGPCRFLTEQEAQVTVASWERLTGSVSTV